MKKIIALSFLLCIPVFMAAQTFKIVGVDGSQYMQKKLLGKIMVMNFYKNAIKIFPQERESDITIVNKSSDKENTYHAELENGRTVIRLTLNTMFSYVRSAHLEICEKNGSTNYRNQYTTIELERE